MDINAVRVALAAAADNISGLNCFAYVPDSVPEPCFYVGEIEIEFDKAMGRGLDELTVTCRVLVSHADDQSGQKALDAYMAGSGALSVKAALEAARGAPGQLALSGACHDFRVERVQGHGVYPVGDTNYYSAEWVVRVIG